MDNAHRTIMWLALAASGIRRGRSRWRWQRHDFRGRVRI